MSEWRSNVRVAVQCQSGSSKSDRGPMLDFDQTSEWRPESPVWRLEWWSDVRDAVQCQSGGPMSEWQSDVRMAD